MCQWDDGCPRIAKYLAASPLPSCLPPANGAKALHHIIDGIDNVALGQGGHRYLDVVQAEGTVASFAEEMNVAVAHAAHIGRAAAQLVFHRPAAVLEGMHDVVLQQQGERARNGGLVQRAQRRLQLEQRCRAGHPCQLLHHQDARRRGADALLREICLALFR